MIRRFAGEPGRPAGARARRKRNRDEKRNRYVQYPYNRNPEPIRVFFLRHWSAIVMIVLQNASLNNSP